MSTLAIIPARAGSKRLKNKNILPLQGKPLITYTIEAAISSGVFDNICVTTDSESIIQIAQSMGLNVPFKRPDILSGDNASSMDVILHAIEFYEKNMNMKYDAVCLLQPTSPLRSASDISNAFDFFVTKGANSVISVTPADHPKQYYGQMGPGREMTEFVNNLDGLTRSQDLNEFYRLNGAIYFAKSDVLKQQKSFYLNERCFGFIMAKENSVDIDDLFDFEITEFLLSKKIK